MKKSNSIQSISISRGAFTQPLYQNQKSIFLFLAFLGSTAIMALTFNVVIVVLWVLLWVFAHYYSTLTKGTEFLIFIIGYYLFYPAASTAYGDIHHRGIVLSGILLIFIILYRPQVNKLLHKNKTAKIIFYGWIVWGILAYLPVFFINFIQNSFIYKETERSAGLVELTRDSTILKTVVPTITAVIVILIPLYALRNVKDFESFWRAFFKGTLILLVLSLIRYVFYIDFIPQSYLEIRSYGFRMTGFSMPDPNGFGRQLLMPILFMAAFSIRFPRRMKLYGWITISLAMLCLILTYSRTTYISFFLSLIFLLLLNVRNKRTIVFIIIIALLIGSLISLTDIQQYFGYGGKRLSLGNLEGRIRLYKASLKILAESPLFGAFPGGFQIALAKIHMKGLQYGVSAHNMFLVVAVEWGIPMAMLLLLALIYSFWSGIIAIRKLRKTMTKKKNFHIESLAYGVVAVSVAFSIHGLAENISPYFVFFNLGIALAIRRIINSFSSESPELKSSNIAEERPPV